MCKDGKCQERAGRIRSTVISLGTAARALAQLDEYPQMVVKTPLYIAIVPSDPTLTSAPDPALTVIMDVYPTTTDDEIARKADLFVIESTTRRVPKFIQMLEALLESADSASPSTQSTLIV